MNSDGIPIFRGIQASLFLLQRQGHSSWKKICSSCWLISEKSTVLSVETNSQAFRQHLLTFSEIFRNPVALDTGIGTGMDRARWRQFWTRQMGLPTLVEVAEPHYFGPFRHGALRCNQSEAVKFRQHQTDNVMTTAFVQSIECCSSSLWMTIHNVKTATNSPSFEGTSTWFAAIRPTLKTWLYAVVEFFFECFGILFNIIYISVCFCERSAWHHDHRGECNEPWGPGQLHWRHATVFSFRPVGLRCDVHVMCMSCACDAQRQTYGTLCKIKCCMMSQLS